MTKTTRTLEFKKGLAAADEMLRDEAGEATPDQLNVCLSPDGQSVKPWQGHARTYPWRMGAGSQMYVTQGTCAFRIVYDGAGLDARVAIDPVANTMSFYSNYGTTTLDAGLGTGGVVDLTEDTGQGQMQDLIDLIDTDGDWSAYTELEVSHGSLLHNPAGTCILSKVDPADAEAEKVQPAQATDGLAVMAGLSGRTEHLIVSIPPECLGLATGRGLMVIDQMTGRAVGLSYHRGGTGQVGSERPYPVQLCRLNRVAAHEYPEIVHMKARTYFFTAWDEARVWDGVDMRRMGIRDPQMPPVVKTEHAAFRVVRLTDGDDPSYEINTTDNYLCLWNNYQSWVDVDLSHVDGDNYPDGTFVDLVIDLEAAASDTAGELADAINADVDWAAHLGDVARSELTFDTPDVLLRAVDPAVEGRDVSDSTGGLAEVQDKRVMQENGSDSLVSVMNAVDVPTGNDAPLSDEDDGDATLHWGVDITSGAFNTVGDAAQVDVHLRAAADRTIFLDHNRLGCHCLYRSAHNDYYGENFYLFFAASADGTGNRLEIPLSTGISSKMALNAWKRFEIAEADWNWYDGTDEASRSTITRPLTAFEYNCVGIRKGDLDANKHMRTHWSWEGPPDLRIWTLEFRVDAIETYDLNPDQGDQGLGIQTSDDWIFCFTWWDPKRLLESGPSPMSQWVSLGTGQRFFVDLAGWHGGIVQYAWNTPPPGIGTIRLYCHRRGWGKDLKTGGPRFHRLHEGDVPAQKDATAIEGLGVQRLVEVGADFEEDMLQLQPSPPYLNRVPPSCALAIPDENRIVLADQPPYSVGRAAIDNMSHELRIVEAWTKDSDSSRGYYALGSAPGAGYTFDPENTPRWGKWLEGRRIRIGEDPKAYRIDKSLEGAVTGAETTWGVRHEWTFDDSAADTLVADEEGSVSDVRLYGGDNTVDVQLGDGLQLVDSQIDYFKTNGYLELTTEELGPTGSFAVEGLFYLPTRAYTMWRESLFRIGHAADNSEIHLQLKFHPGLFDKGALVLDLGIMNGAAMTWGVAYSYDMHTAGLDYSAFDTWRKFKVERVGNWMTVYSAVIGGDWVLLGTTDFGSRTYGSGATTKAHFGYSELPFDDGVDLALDEYKIYGLTPVAYDSTALHVSQDEGVDTRPYDGDAETEAEYEILGEEGEIWWTGKDTSGLNTESVPDNAHRDLEMPGDRIVALAHVGATLVVAGHKHIAYLRQNEEALDDSLAGGVYPDPHIISGAGCLARRSIVQLGDKRLLWLAPEGNLLLVGEGVFEVHPSSPLFWGWLRGGRVSMEHLQYAHAIYDNHQKRYYLHLIEEQDRGIWGNFGAAPDLVDGFDPNTDNWHDLAWAADPTTIQDQTTTLAVDFAQTLMLDLRHNTVHPGFGQELTCSLSSASPCPPDGILPHQIFAGDRYGMLNRAYGMQDYGLGSPLQRTKWALTNTSTQDVLAIDKTVEGLQFPTDNTLEGLRAAVLYSTGTLEWFRIGAQTEADSDEELIRTDATLAGSPATGDYLLLAPMPCGIMFGETRYLYPAALKALLINFFSRTNQAQTLEWIIRTAAANDIVVDQSSDTHTRTITEANLKQTQSWQYMAPHPSKALAYLLQWYAYAGGPFVLQYMGVEEEEHPAESTRGG